MNKISDSMFVKFSISGIEIILYRDDLNHPSVSGNKLHKLSPNIDLALERGCSNILSFGGPYSNHLHALAWASQKAGLKSTGVVRGEINQQLTPTLKDCMQWGMQLIPINRKDYRSIQNSLNSNSAISLANELEQELSSLTIENPSKTLVIPEGGSNLLAIKSVSEAYQNVFDALLSIEVSHAVCATGTGATLAGLYLASPRTTKIIGMQAVAEHEATFQRIQTWLNRPLKRLSIVESHLGKFGKMTLELSQFIEKFQEEHGVPLDPVYTSKAMMKLISLIEQGYFKNSDRVLFIHTGGIQGKR